MTFRTRRSLGGSLVAVLLCLLFSTAVYAQTDKEAEEAAASLAICKGIETDIGAEGEEINKYRPCEQYIDTNIKNNADTVKWILEQINLKKNTATDISNDYYRNDQILQMTIIFF